MQNKQALIGIAAAVIILLGAGGVFLYSQNKSPKPQPNTTTSQTAQENTEPSVSNSLTSLLKSGKTQQCSFSSDDLGGGSTKGVVYVTGNKMRSDVTISTAEKESSISVIRNGDDNYIWGSEFPNSTGIKMTLSLDEYASDSGSDSKKYFDPTKKVDYDCSGWTVDSFVFNPPSNIKFSDFSAMMESMMKISKTPTGGTGNSSQCSVCNSLSGDAKTACLSQLNCQ